MYNKMEAKTRAKHSHIIFEAKKDIEEKVTVAVDAGYMKCAVDISSYNVDVRNLLTAWVKSFGYDVIVDSFDDPRSDWTITKMIISWED